MNLQKLGCKFLKKQNLPLNKKVSQSVQCFMEKAAPCFVEGKNFAVFPFFLTDYKYPLFSDLRKYFLSDVISKQKSEYVIFDKMGISPYLYERDNDYVMIAVNGNTDTFDSISFKIGNVDFKGNIYA